jgi:hypothetical protein
MGARRGIETFRKRLTADPTMMRVRKSTVENSYGTTKCWIGDTHFKMEHMHHVSTEMSLHVLANNMKRVIKIIGAKRLIQVLAV